jgi:hypothetical protein
MAGDPNGDRKVAMIREKESLRVTARSCEPSRGADHADGERAPTQ